MSIANNQLEEIFEETRQRFDNNPLIQITPLEGTPPEKYEILYKIKGLHKEDGQEPFTSENHIVTISIPFGFPHFPPSCTPNSPIYHPDFDPAAICIGDFWNQDKSLSDLIVYIGQLIAGENFSTENAFNEDAASWYQENSAKLPFAVFEVEAAVPTDSAPPIDDLDDLDDDLELDVIDDDDLEEDFSYLAIDDASDTFEAPPEIPQESVQEQALPEDEVDHDLILLMRKKKRFYALNEYLMGLAPSVQFDQREQIEKLTNDELEAAQVIYGKAEEFEHQGKPQESLASYKEVRSKVSDFPAIDEDITRATQSLELLGGISEKDQTEEPSPNDNESDAEEPKKKKKKLTLFEDEHSKKAMGTMPIALGIVAILILLTATYLYFSINRQYNKATKLYQQCEQSLAQNDFFSTDRYCSQALGAIKKVQFWKSSDKAELTSAIGQILSSKRLKEGLKGNVEYNGKYIAASSLKSIERFQKFHNAGKEAFKLKDWNQATEYLSQAIAISKTNMDIERALLPPIETMNNTAIFNHSYKNGVELTKLRDWTKSSNQLNNALIALASLDQQTQEKYKREIRKLHEEATFFSLENKANTLFNNGKWEEALTVFQKCKINSPNFLASNPEKKKAINEKITKATLYQAIKSGKEAFAQSDWDIAIQKYDAAIKTLNENQEILKQGNSSENKKKLSRIKLQASIIRDQQDAARKLKDKKLDQAIQILQSITTAINASPFKEEQDFAAIRTETNHAIATAQEEQFIIDKTSYLEENYQSIFIENYPTATEESLQDPKIDFVKSIDEGLLFKLQCLEKGRGRPLRLVINYLYNPKTDSWSFYNQ